MKTKQNAINCTSEEAIKIGGQMCVSQVMVLNNLFAKFNNEHLTETKDYYTSLLFAVSDIFAMGYVSGVRAERNKKAKAKN